MRARPTLRWFSFRSQYNSPGCKDAYTQARESAEGIRQTLRGNGMDPASAQISSFVMTPVYQWNPKRKLVGYQVNSSVTIKTHDFEKLGALADTFSQVESDEALTISYTLDNIEAAKAKAVEDAFRHAKLNAEALVRAAARNLGTVVYASVDANEFVPQPRPMMMRAHDLAKVDVSPMQDFTPAKITVTAHVNVLFQLK